MTEGAIEKRKAAVPVSASGANPTDLEGVYRLAQAAVAGSIGKKWNRAEDAMIAILKGQEMGMKPMQALDSIIVINGRPSLTGDAALAMVQRSGLLRNLRIDYAGKQDDYGCTVTTQRKGDSGPVSSTFTVRDAKRAGLWGKKGPWTEYPQRMLKYRAVGFHLRDYYADAMQGLVVSEELHDYPASAGKAPGPSEPAALLEAAPEAEQLDEPTPEAEQDHDGDSDKFDLGAELEKEGE